MAEFLLALDKLCQGSTKHYVNPYSYLEWPNSTELNQWYMSPELLSVYGTELYDGLSEQEKMRLSFYEAVNFFSLNIHGEKSLVQGLAHRIYETGHSEITPYLQHMLAEENGHMVYFGGFCMRYAGKVYPDKKLVFPREYASGEEDFLFFAKTLIFEEIVDSYNVKMAKDERLAPIARQINLIHHLEESRHLAFGRMLVKKLFEQYAPSWSKGTLQVIRDYLRDYVVATWKEYYNPAAYTDAGLEDPYGIREAALNHPLCREHRQRISEKCVLYLLENSVLDKEPSL